MNRVEEFVRWSKIPRWHKPWLLTEKIDGTNAHIAVEEVGDDYAPGDGVTLVQHHDTTYAVRAASRNRWLAPGSDDNFGFAAWVAKHADQLAHLGIGRHYGEWYGQGIQRTYQLPYRRWALFDPRWAEELPSCLPDEVHAVPVIARCDGPDLSAKIAFCLDYLDRVGSHAAPGRRPEGVVAHSTADRSVRFKAILDDTAVPQVVTAR